VPFRGLALSPKFALGRRRFGARASTLLTRIHRLAARRFVAEFLATSTLARRGRSHQCADCLVGMSSKAAHNPVAARALAQMDVSAFPPTIAPATQPEIFLSSRAPRFCKLTLSGDHVYLTFCVGARRPYCRVNAASPDNFKLLPRMPPPSTLQSHKTARLRGA